MIHQRHSVGIFILSFTTLAACGEIDPQSQSFCGNGILEAEEQCDLQIFATSCQDLYPNADAAHGFCLASCQPVCAIVDYGFQTSYPDVEQTDELCSNGLNDFETKDKNGNLSSWVDCNNYGCVMSPIVQVCQALENTDATCSDNIDNPTSKKLPNGMQNIQNGLIDCQDPSCFKNPRVTVCAAQAPRWELGADCLDNLDNDGDTLPDCQDPDCLHAGGICILGSMKRILFDNAHHQIAGSADWIVDITGRHPYPSRPIFETDWHGSLSSWGKDLLDTGRYVIETLIQDRRMTYQIAGELQDLSQYHVLISVEPSSKFTADEIQAIGQFVYNGGGLVLFADHKGADRDGNLVDAVDAINDLLKSLSSTGTLENNPFGFYVAENESMQNDIAIPSPQQYAHPIVQGPHGNVAQTGTYAGTVFHIPANSHAMPILVTQSAGLPYVVASTYGLGRIVAIGDSSIAGDATNMLGITHTSHDAYHDTSLSNRTFLLNMIDWVSGQ